MITKTITNFHVFLTSESKIDSTFSTMQFKLKEYKLFRHDHNRSQIIFRGGCRTAETPKMELFVITVNGFKVNKALHLGCCSSPTSASEDNL